jgi:hypothetical protein
MRILSYKSTIVKAWFETQSQKLEFFSPCERVVR